MSERNEYREILQRAKVLSRVGPNVDDAARVIDRVRAQFQSQRVNRHRRMWIMSGSIAAGVLIAFGIFISFTPDSARAAEDLQRVADASRKYQGWVHIRTEGELPTTAPSTARTTNTATT